MNALVPEKLMLKNDVVEDLILNVPGRAHLKTADSHQYILSNEKNLALYGFKTPKDIIGKTVHDMDILMKPFWGDKFAAFIETLDYTVVNNKTTVRDPGRLFLTSQGFIHYQNMKKLPICGDNDNIVAILTMSETITSTISLWDLYKTYKKLYQHKKKAILMFLTHTRMLGLFHTPLTDAELKVLLCMKNYTAAKSIAHMLKSNHRTIESHIDAIRSKLKDSNLDFLMLLIRNGHYNPQ